jgi:2,3-dihydro-2,3-dihydroxybenzoate dehydrogenase
MRASGIDGKIAIVTGAAGGIGAEVVRLLLEEGARVVATDIQREPLMARHGGDSLSLRARQLDVGDSVAVNALVAETEAEWGPIDIGVNVAGILATGLVADISDEDWARVFAVNTTGVFNLSRALARVMTPRRQGGIVTVSSNAGGIPRYAMAAYAASKAAATMFTRCLGLELAPHGIRCNIIAPGSTMTDMQTGMWADEKGGERVIAGSLETYKTGIPLQRIASAEDVANSVIFMLSDQARHITMADLYVDGGATLRG